MSHRKLTHIQQDTALSLACAIVTPCPGIDCDLSNLPQGGPGLSFSDDGTLMYRKQDFVWTVAPDGHTSLMVQRPGRKGDAWWPDGDTSVIILSLTPARDGKAASFTTLINGPEEIAPDPHRRGPAMAEPDDVSLALFLAEATVRNFPTLTAPLNAWLRHQKSLLSAAGTPTNTTPSSRVS